MAESKHLQRQVERILDEAPESQVEVIIQVESDRGTSTRLAQAAGEALSRQRLSLTPRDLLPKGYRKRITPQAKQETASTRTLLGRATAETLALAKIQQMGLNPMDSLLQNGIVRAALGRMVRPARRSARRQRQPSQFWTSRSMPLRLERDELQRLPEEVDNIKSIHLNRHLSLPAMVETRKLQIEAEEILISTWGIEQIKALSVWGAYGARGKGVTIGLLDTGVDASHPDLQDKVVHWAEFDSLGNNIGGSVPHDTDEHGTHCAGTIVGANTSGRFIGVAPEAHLAAALVLNGDQGGTDAQVLAGIDWAVETGVDVISLSLGGLVMDAETPPTYTEAILTCMEAGIPVVAAIGNEGQQTTGSPGNDLFALSVGATDPRSRVAGFSGGRTQIIRESDYIDLAYLPLAYSKPDLSAPGVAIYSSVPGKEWKSFSGTSMAAPHVAGAIALLLSATGIKEKETGVHRGYLIKDLILGSVEELGESGQDHRYGFGRFDALRAIDFARQRGY
jgi:hypothetical protein